MMSFFPKITTPGPKKIRPQNYCSDFLQVFNYLTYFPFPIPVRTAKWRWCNYRQSTTRSRRSSKCTTTSSRSRTTCECRSPSQASKTLTEYHTSVVSRSRGAAGPRYASHYLIRCRRFHAVQVAPLSYLVSSNSRHWYLNLWSGVRRYSVFQKFDYGTCCQLVPFDAVVYSQSGATIQ